VTESGNALATSDAIPLFTATSGSYAGGFSSVTGPAVPTGLAANTSQLAGGTRGNMTFSCDGLLTAGSPTYYRTSGQTCKIPIANLLALASRTTGTTLNSVATSTANSKSVLTNNTYVYVEAGTVADSFSYSIMDTNGCTAGGTVTLNIASSVTGQPTAYIDSSLTLSFAGIPGCNYSVQRSADLANWTTIWTTNAPSSGVFTFADPNAPPIMAYYRLAYVGP